MKIKRFSFKHKVLLFFLLFIIGGAIFLISATKAGTILGKKETTVIYTTSPSEQVDKMFSSRITKNLFGTKYEVSDIDNDDFDGYRKKIYPSPNRKYIAVTSGSFDAVTYIADLNGKKITSAYSGSFTSWAPDSKKVLLGLTESDETGRSIYFLHTDGEYYNSGLPARTISASISPKDGSIVYSVTDRNTDNSTIYVRDINGNDRLLKEGRQEILAFVRWSLDGGKIAFMKSDLYIRPGQQSIHIIDADGTNEKKISDVLWSYSLVWSPKGDKILFSNGDIWEYDVASESLKQITRNSDGSARHPNYSEDGKTIVFSANDQGGIRQIWAIQDGSVIQLTDGVENKNYPILP